MSVRSCWVATGLMLVAVLSAGRALADEHVYLDIALTGSELDGPKPTPTTDLELFSGLGLAFAVGYQGGMWRADLEWHVHTASAFAHSDSIDVRTLMVNGYFDLPLGKHFALTVGAGVGRASVDVEYTSCLDPLGCPAFSFTDVIADDSGSAQAYQYSLTGSWLFSDADRMTIGFRQLSTSDLGLEDSLGKPFSDDQLDMPLAIIGWQHRFRHPSAP